MLTNILVVAFLILGIWFLYIWFTGDRTSLQLFGYCLLIFLLEFAVYLVF
jgi:hypothetical protein